MDLPGDKVQTHGIKGGRLASGTGGCAMHTAVELVLGAIGDQELVVAAPQEALGAVVDEGVVRVGHAARYPLDGKLPGHLQNLGGRDMGAGIAGCPRRHRCAQLGGQQLHQRGAVRLVAKHQHTGGHQRVGQQGADGHHLDEDLQAHGERHQGGGHSAADRGQAGHIGAVPQLRQLPGRERKIQPDPWAPIGDSLT